MQILFECIRDINKCERVDGADDCNIFHQQTGFPFFNGEKSIKPLFVDSVLDTMEFTYKRTTSRQAGIGELGIYATRKNGQYKIDLMCMKIFSSLSLSVLSIYNNKL